METKPLVLGHTPIKPLKLQQGQVVTDRFFQKIKSAGSGCWEWLGSLSESGYGRFYYAGKSYAAHRFAWALWHGETPVNKLVCHKCDNAKCVNPDHLFLGSHTENMRDMTAKGRHLQQQKTHCAKGHQFTPENTFYKKGRRNCRSCDRERARNYQGRIGNKVLAERRKLYVPSPIETRTQTHCIRGHEFTKENSRIRPDGSRKCRKCDALRVAQNRLSKRAA